MKEVLQRDCYIYSSERENSNKFYILETVKEFNQYKVIARYGRIGRKPAVKETPCRSKYHADEIFTKKGREKITKGYMYTELETIMALDGTQFFG